MASGSQPKVQTSHPFRPVSDAAREHEAYKYAPNILINAQKNLQNGQLLPNSELFSSKDTILTALAQLAVFQTGTARSLVSFFDSTYQYIAAESTPNLPLLPSLSADDRGESLWLCGTAFPRQFSICTRCLLQEGSGRQSGNIQSSDLPLELVPDLASDPDITKTPLFAAGLLARFYAAVPIRTFRGINIGVLCVLDTVPRDDWTDARTAALRNISRSIMSHLESGRYANFTRRNMRMNRGLGSFVEGEATLTGWQAGPGASAFANDPKKEGGLNPQQQRKLRNAQPSDYLTARPLRPECDPLTPELSSGESVRTPEARRDMDDDIGRDISPLNHIFSRAANIIRESIEVEGCVFYDAEIKSFGGLDPHVDSSTPTHTALESSSTSGSEDSSRSSNSGPSSSTTSAVLGFSNTSESSIDGVQHTVVHSAMAEKFLSKLLRRYPKGKIFNFDASGELVGSSEGSGDDMILSPMARAQARSQASQSDLGRTRRNPWARTKEGSVIRQIFPGARSVAFVPVWDSRKERWSSGAFIYTNKPARTFTTLGELSYLRAFGTLTIVEVLRLSTQMADKAKSDMLSSLSHELRSPLHGVVLSAELLRDTRLDVFQGHVIHTIETCARTLTDTVDHLLDFSKINSFAGALKDQSKPRRRALDRRGSTNSLGAQMKSIYSDVRLDGLTEEVIESVFAGFNFQFASMAQVQRQRGSAQYSDKNSANTVDTFGDPILASKHGFADSTDIPSASRQVSILLDIDPECSWTFHTQPGALRRIIMNLFGNALKYTTHGAICVRLRQEKEIAGRSPDVNRKMIITIIDSGRGISQDYLRHDIYKAFTQENYLESGTGLGLSIVKQITTALGGSISIRSKQGQGTTASVTLPMQPIYSPFNGPLMTSDDDQDLADQILELRGLRVRLLGFDPQHFDNDHQRPALGDYRDLIEQTCSKWLQMDVISGDDNKYTPDVVLATELAMPNPQAALSNSPPCVVVYADPHAAYHASTASTSVTSSGVFEFVSQPIGPRKLAKILLLAFKRWVELQTTAESLSETQSDIMSGIGSRRASPTPRSGANVGQQYSTPPSTTPDMTLELPLRNITNDARGLSESSSRNAPTPVEETPNGTTEPVAEFLLVDDNNINLKILTSYMKRLSRPFGTAMNGQEAIDEFRSNPRRYSCILMDLSMPVMDGFEATRRIRAFERENQLPPTTIFALSGLASESAQQEAYSSGINYFLTKPVRLKELASTLKMNGLL